MSVSWQLRRRRLGPPPLPIVPTENLETSERLWLILASEFSLMLVFLKTLLAVLPSILSSRAAFELKNLALRHQIGVLQRSAAERPKLTAADRLFWICLSRVRTPAGRPSDHCRRLTAGLPFISAFSFPPNYLR